jgi:Ca2+-binding EF-hand superfamily protein
MELNMASLFEKLGIQVASKEERFRAFEATARRRRLMKKQTEAQIQTLLVDLVGILAEMTETPDERSESDKALYGQIKDTFNAFDRDGNAELGFPEYYEAWKFLSQPGSDEQIKQAFDSVDVDGTGLVDWEEFVFSIMGEKALNFGSLAEMDLLKGLLGNVAAEYGLLRESLQETRMSAEERAGRNKRLRDRLENMKGEVSGQVNDLLSKMLGIKPEDILSGEEINAHLTEAFNKFDEDRSGELGQWEFTQAWIFLGLKGSEGEINDAYKGVDTNNSGLIDIDEFKTAIKGERMAELSLMSVLTKMGVQLKNIDGEYDRFKATMDRRRLMKKQYEEDLEKMTTVMIDKLYGLVKKTPPKQDPKVEKMYNTLKDTFNAFDKDGSA